jgi:hypothetical protein
MSDSSVCLLVLVLYAFYVCGLIASLNITFLYVIWDEMSKDCVKHLHSRETPRTSNDQCLGRLSLQLKNTNTLQSTLNNTDLYSIALNR